MVISYHPNRSTNKSIVVAVANGSNLDEIGKRMDLVMDPSTTTMPALNDHLASYDLLPSSSLMKKVHLRYIVPRLVVYIGALGNIFGR